MSRAQRVFIVRGVCIASACWLLEPSQPRSALAVLALSVAFGTVKSL